jgi:hypothetical protein
MERVTRLCSFCGMDDLPWPLLDGIRNGFFDPAVVNKHASALNDKLRAAKLDNSFLEAWRMYHDSFDNNQEEVLNAIHQSLPRCTWAAP